MELPEWRPEPKIVKADWPGKEESEMSNAVVRRIIVKEIAGGVHRIDRWCWDVVLPLLEQHELKEEALLAIEMIEKTDKLVKGLNAWLDEQL